MQIKKILLKILILLFVYGLGIYSYKNENIRGFITGIYHSFSNPSVKTCESNKIDYTPHYFELIIPDSSKTILQECRENALLAGILQDKFKIKVPASLVFNDDTINVKLRLKGDYRDHWSGSKWSYRVYLKGGKHIFGMKTFSLQSPKTRGMLNEWYFHSLLKEEGLIALRNEYVSLIENGVEKGIYLVEESFDKYLLENNLRRDAPILKFDESIWIDCKKVNKFNQYSQEEIFIMSKIDMFKSKSILKDSLLLSHYYKARILIEKLKNQKNKLSDIIDIEKAAKLFAIADLTRGHHALRWKNIRFYFNPILGKLELIGFDSNSGGLITDIYYNKWSKIKLDVYDVFFWKSLFFNDPKFVNLYIDQLRRLSTSSYLENFNLKIKAQLDINSACVCKDYPTYFFSSNKYVKNAQIIREKLNQYDKGFNEVPSKYFISAKASSQIRNNDKKIEISFSNNSTKDVYIIGIYNGSEKLISDKYSIKLNSRKIGKIAEYEKLVFNLFIPLDENQTFIKRKSNIWVYKDIKIGYYYANSLDTMYTKIEAFYDKKLAITDEYNLPDEMFIVDHVNKKVEILSGEWVFNKDVVTPLAYDVTCDSNTHMTFNNSSSLVLNGKVIFRGTINYPIVIDSKDSTGSFFVSQASGISYLENVIFNNLSESIQGKRCLSGSITFYESDVIINNVTILSNNSEDALNLVLSDFTISNCLFQDIYSDALDGDYCTGKISNCKFSKIGNDALDFSGSAVSLKNISIDHVADKGISAGEKSVIIGSQIKIDSVEIGIVSKDQSKISLDQIEINQTIIPYVVFQKKNEFGPAEITFTNFISKGNKEPYLLESNCKAKVNGKNILSNYKNIKSILYGNIYGKKSG